MYVKILRGNKQFYGLWSPLSEALWVSAAVYAAKRISQCSITAWEPTAMFLKCHCHITMFTPVSHYKPAAKMQPTTDTQLKLKRYDKLTTYQSVWQGTDQTVQISPAIQSQVTKLNSSSIFADSRATQSINGNNITVLLYATKMHPSNKDISTWIRRQVTTKSKPTAFLSQLLITHPII